MGDIRLYDELDELNEEADTVVKRMPDAPEFLVTEHSWEWLHNFDDTAGEQGHKWLYSLSLGALTKHTGTLELYVDLMLIVGPRSTKTVRTQTDSTFYNMVAAGTGGQLMAGVKKYYYPGDAGAVPMEASYLAMQPREGSRLAALRDRIRAKEVASAEAATPVVDAQGAEDSEEDSAHPVLRS